MVFAGYPTKTRSACGKNDSLMAILPQSTLPPAAGPVTAPRLRLNFLDGLRGLAALYVMLAHVFSITAYGDDGRVSAALPPAFVWATRGLCFPHYAVAVFIVLSGFCLMLPVSRSKNGNLPGGLLGFAKRRARRILPPYYVALTFVLVILFASHHLVKHTGSGATDLSAADIGTHFLLIHNLFSHYSMQIDIPMWSVAWEWQIYFFFALLLLPVWRRFGSLWTVALAFALGFLPQVILPAASNLSWTSPWYLGLFALGMAAADALCRPDSGTFRLLQDTRFLTVSSGVLAAGLVALATTQPSWFGGFYWLGDLYIGLFAALLILACAHPSKPNLLNAVVRGLESRPLMTLGAFSYSLYLVHFPVLIKLQGILHNHGASHLVQFFALLCIGAPLCLGLAYLFHLAFERPFMPGHPKTERQAEAAALVSPAP